MTDPPRFDFSPRLDWDPTAEATATSTALDVQPAISALALDPAACRAALLKILRDPQWTVSFEEKVAKKLLSPAEAPSVARARERILSTQKFFGRILSMFRPSRFMDDLKEQTTIAFVAGFAEGSRDVQEIFANYWRVNFGAVLAVCACGLAGRGTVTRSISRWQVARSLFLAASADDQARILQETHQYARVAAEERLQVDLDYERRLVWWDRTVLGWAFVCESHELLQHAGVILAQQVETHTLDDLSFALIPLILDRDLLSRMGASDPARFSRYALRLMKDRGVVDIPTLRKVVESCPFDPSIAEIVLVMARMDCRETAEAFGTWLERPHLQELVEPWLDARPHRAVCALYPRLDRHSASMFLTRLVTLQPEISAAVVEVLAPPERVCLDALRERLAHDGYDFSPCIRWDAGAETLAREGTGVEAGAQPAAELDLNKCHDRVVTLITSPEWDTKLQKLLKNAGTADELKRARDRLVADPRVRLSVLEHADIACVADFSSWVGGDRQVQEAFLDYWRAAHGPVSATARTAVAMRIPVSLAAALSPWDLCRGIFRNCPVDTRLEIVGVARAFQKVAIDELIKTREEGQESTVSHHQWLTEVIAWAYVCRTHDLIENAVRYFCEENPRVLSNLHRFLAPHLDLSQLLLKAGAAPSFFQGISLALIRQHGPAAIPLLRSVGDPEGEAAWSSDEVRRAALDAARALSRLENPETAAAFVSWLSRDSLIPAIRPWLDSHPHLAVRALAERGELDAPAVMFLTRLVVLRPDAVSQMARHLTSGERELLSSIGKRLVADDADLDWQEPVVRWDAEAEARADDVPQPDSFGRPLPNPWALVRDHGANASGPLLEILGECDGWRRSCAEYKLLRKNTLHAMTCLESETVARQLAPFVRDPSLGGLVRPWFERRPRLGFHSLYARVLEGASPDDRYRVLLHLVSTRPDVVEWLKPRVDRDEKRALMRLMEQAGLLGEARAEEVPSLLLSPPWKQRRAPAPRVVLDRLTTPPHEESIVWEEGGQARWIGRVDDPKARKEHLSEFNSQSTTLWDEEERLSLLALHGLQALPGVIAYASTHFEDVPELIRIDSPRLAPLIAHRLGMRRCRRQAEQWLLRFPRTAALGLLPPALGAQATTRDEARAALRYLTTHGHRAEIDAVGTAFGPQVASAWNDVASTDPIFDLPARIPRLPAVCDLRACIRPRINSHVLPLTGVANLAIMLAFSPMDPPYAGLTAVKEALDPRSRHEFAWSLFEMWMDAGAPHNARWMMLALGHLGTDDTVNELLRFIEEWPRHGQYRRSIDGLDCLVMIGSDFALRQLHKIALKSTRKGLRDEARTRIDVLAAGLGLDGDDLADRLVPRLDLDEQRTRVLVFGARAFTVGFDAQLRPYVKDSTGKRLAELPKVGTKDDAALGKQAHATWKSLKKSVREVGALQIQRLEAAMCRGRRWSVADFQQNLVAHPLLTHLTQGLVWELGRTDHGRVCTFRVAEDCSCADIDDRQLKLPSDGHHCVTLPHRLSLSQGELVGWGRLFADYGVIQPFAQLSREVYVPTDAERAAHRSDRFAGREAVAGRLLVLESKGWRRGSSGFYGGATFVLFTRKANGVPLQVALFLDPGIDVGMI